MMKNEEIAIYSQFRQTLENNQTMESLVEAFNTVWNTTVNNNNGIAVQDRIERLLDETDELHHLINSTNLPTLQEQYKEQLSNLYYELEQQAYGDIPLEITRSIIQFAMNWVNDMVSHAAENRELYLPAQQFTVMTGGNVTIDHTNYC